MTQMDGNCCDPKPWAVALARWCLGLILLVYGLGKFPDVSGFAKGLVEQFAKTWLPGWLLIPYGYALPFIELGLGALLLIGLWRNGVLLITGIYLISLTFGMTLLKQPGVVFNNFVFTLAAAAILFLGDYDRWTIGGGRRMKGEN